MSEIGRRPSRAESKRAISRDLYDAVLLDLDGVITDTASVHAACWKQMFDDYLQKRAAQMGEAFRAFDIATDYRLYVDGRPRYDGVRNFLTSRGIRLTEGSPDDPPEAETVSGSRQPQERPGQQNHPRKRGEALRGQRQAYPSAPHSQVQNRRGHLESELHGCVKRGQTQSLL